MAKIESLKIRRFRGIKDLEVASFNNVNLIVGDNNSGKTSFLEALQLLKISGSISNVYKVASQRENLYGTPGRVYDNVKFMFPQGENSLCIDISGVINNKNISYSLKGEENRILYKNKETDSIDAISKLIYGETVYAEKMSLHRFSDVTGVKISKEDSFPVIYVAPFEHLRGNVIGTIVSNKQFKEVCLGMVRSFEPDIDDIMILRSDEGDYPIDYLHHRLFGNMPLASFGDGLKKALVLVNAIARASDGILLIDEVDTAVHRKHFNEIFLFLTTVCSTFDVQVFITTHSMEAIDALLETQKYDEQIDSDEISIITLRRHDNKTMSRSLNGREVYKQREAFGFEVRL